MLLPVLLSLFDVVAVAVANHLSVENHQIA